MKQLLFLGDSITDCNHYFDPENLGLGYVRMISEQINTPDKNYQVQNFGNDGFTVPALRRLWQRKGLNLKPDFITILIGISILSIPSWSIIWVRVPVQTDGQSMITMNLNIADGSTVTRQGNI